MNWLSNKPDFKEECVLVTASFIRGHWEYTTYIIEKINTPEGWYMGWLTGEGEEYGDLADLQADRYLILQKPD